MTTGQTIKALRLSLKLSQAKFASLCGWDTVRQYRIETDRANLTVKTLQRIADSTKTNLSIDFK